MRKERKPAFRRLMRSGLPVRDDDQVFSTENDDWEDDAPELPLDEYPGDEAFLDADEPERIPGPLSRAPRFVRGMPALGFLAAASLVSLIGWRHNALDAFSLSRDALLVNHEYWRLITSVLAHADRMHLASNAPLLLVFGWFLADYFGWRLFPLVSLLCGMLANLVAVLVAERPISLIGASGMDYAVCALWLVMFIRHDTDHRVTVRMVRAAGFALAMLFPTTFSPEVSYIAHAAGFAIGLVAGFALLPFSPVKR